MKGYHSIFILCVLLLLSGALHSTNVAAGVDSTYTLPASEWHQIAVPAALSPRDEQNTLEAVFADDFEPESYGSTWILWQYIVEDGVAIYRQPALSDCLLAGTGFWIIQFQDAPVIIDLPESSSENSGIADGACGPGVPCLRVPVIDDWPEEAVGVYTMLGKPTTRPTTWNELRVATTQGGLLDPCMVDFFWDT